jgi:predicted esterase
MHGLGDSSSGFLNYFQKPNSPLYSGARIRLLQALQRKVTVSGSTCNSWYDIRTFNKAAGNDEQRYSMEEVKQSYGIIDKEVKKEVEFWEKEQGVEEGGGERQVYLGGFSQGCAMSLFYGLQCERPIAGIIGFSGYLFDSTKTTNLGKTNILLNHGDHDFRAELPHSEKTYQRILSDPHVKFVKYPGMDH